MIQRHGRNLLFHECLFEQLQKIGNRKLVPKAEHGRYEITNFNIHQDVCITN